MNDVNDVNDVNDRNEVNQTELTHAAPEGATVVALASGRALEIERGEGDADLVRIRARGGACVLTVLVTDRGPVLRFEGASLELAARELSIQCEDLRVESSRSASVRSPELSLEATRGELALRANDDVRVTGERILLNSDDPPLPRSMDEWKQRRALTAGENVVMAPRGPEEGQG